MYARPDFDKTDHPLISSCEGSEIRRKDVKEFDEYSAFIGMNETGKDPKTIDLEGKVTKMIYMPVQDRSVLEVFRNYEIAVKQSGDEIIYSCNPNK